MSNTVIRLMINGIRAIFFIIDSILYGLITFFYNVLADIAGISFLSAEGMKAFTDSVYVLVGVIVLFKVAFSLIKQFAEPEGFKADKVGGPAILRRFAIAIVLLASVPLIFQLAFRIQYVVLEHNVVGSIVMGRTGYGQSENKDDIKSAGQTISGTLFSGFFTPAIDEDGNYVCANTEYNTRANVDAKYFERVALVSGDGEYCYNYSFLISTLAGGFTAWIMMIFVLDIAMRSAKLAVLQLLAPFPIIMSIDEKGQSVLKKWIEESISTYADLFVRLFIIFLITFFILEVTSGEGFITLYRYDSDGNLGGGTSALREPLVGSIVIIGILMFASKAPDLIYGIFGLKAPQGFTLNPLKKVGNYAAASAVIGAGAGMVGNAVGKTLRTRKDIAKAEKEQFGDNPETRSLDETQGEFYKRRFMNGLARPLGAAISGGASGAMGGIMHGSQGGNPLRVAEKSMTDSVQRAKAKKQGYDFQARVKDSMGTMLGVEGVFGTTDEIGDRLKELKHSNDILAKQLRYLYDAMGRQLDAVENGQLKAEVATFYNGDHKKDPSSYSPDKFVSNVYSSYKPEFHNTNEIVEKIKSGKDTKKFATDELTKDLSKLKRALSQNGYGKLSKDLEAAIKKDFKENSIDKIASQHDAYIKRASELTEGKKKENALEKAKGSFSKKDK